MVVFIISFSLYFFLLFLTKTKLTMSRFLLALNPTINKSKENKFLMKFILIENVGVVCSFLKVCDWICGSPKNKLHHKLFYRNYSDEVKNPQISWSLFSKIFAKMTDFRDLELLSYICSWYFSLKKLMFRENRDYGADTNLGVSVIVLKKFHPRGFIGS